MYSRELSWKLLFGIALPVTLAIVAILWLVRIDVARAREADGKQALADVARLLAAAAPPAADARSPALEALIAGLRADGVQVDILAADGRPLLESSDATRDAAALLRRPEIAIAREQGVAADIRPDGRDETRLSYAAARIDRGEWAGAVVALARPVRAAAGSPQLLVRTATIGVLLIVVTVLAIAYVHARRWTGLLRRITHAATGLSAGDLSVRADVAGSEELEVLAGAINETRQRLAASTQTIDRQRRTFESLLNQLREGVVVVGRDRRIVLMNPAAIRLMALSGAPSPSAYVGLAVERVIPLLDLQRLLLASEPATEAPATTPDRPAWESRVQIENPRGTTHLLAHSSEIMLPGGVQETSGPLVGRVLVLTDITDLTRTIQMKTDFVANASHELRTPLSTIRAAVETLQSLDLAAEASGATRFLAVIERQSARLEALASDLLDLTKLESGGSRFRPRSVMIHELLADLRQHFAERLSAKRIRWSVDTEGCDRTAIVASPQLLRLVLDNLVDNAVKFTEPDRAVCVRCTSTRDSVSFTVVDEGCGIDHDEQERVFERFYQVERGRSGVERGTGLGLSIVRHAVSAMEGQVRLQSSPGAGTRVTVTIPQPSTSAA